MNLIEQAVIGKYQDVSLCEDGLFNNEHFVAVIDGATSKGVLKWKGHTSGYYAKQLILESLSQLPYDTTAVAAITQINEYLALASTPHIEELKRNPFERMMASVLIYSCHRNQIWSFGDCQFLVNDRYYKQEKAIDSLLAEIRSFCLYVELASGKSIAELQMRDIGREMIIPFLKLQPKFANQKGEYGFAVLDGFEIDTAEIQVVNTNPGDQIVLATDGYPMIGATLQESENEWELIKNVDPLCMNQFKSTKGFMTNQYSFDDRTYVRFFAT